MTAKPYRLNIVSKEPGSENFDRAGSSLDHESACYEPSNYEMTPRFIDNIVSSRILILGKSNKPARCKPIFSYIQPKFSKCGDTTILADSLNQTIISSTNTCKSKISDSRKGQYANLALLRKSKDPLDSNIESKSIDSSSFEEVAIHGQVDRSRQPNIQSISLIQSEDQHLTEANDDLDGDSRIAWQSRGAAIESPGDVSKHNRLSSFIMKRRILPSYMHKC